MSEIGRDFGDLRWAGASVLRRDAGSDAGSAEVGAGAVVDADRRSVRVVMSTDFPVGGADPEDGDVVPQEEWSFDRWLRSGAVVLEGHQMGPGMCGGPQADVVGNAADIERDEVVVDGRRLVRTLATVTWSRVAPRGQVLADQYASGERADFSVGFVARKAIKRTALAEGDPYRVDPAWSRESGRPGGRLLRSPMLIELSAVTVGADMYATTVRALGGIPDAGGGLTWAERRAALVRGALASPDALAEAGAVLRELAANPAGWAVLEDVYRAVRAQHDPLIRALAALR